MKILIVEDETGLSESISSHLGKENFICERAFTYEEAYEKINLYTYDCVIVDINLPDGFGFGIVEKLKSLSATTGIIILSARNSIDDKLKGLEIGSDDYMTKPFHLSELNARIKSLMRRRQFNGNNEIIYNEIRIIPNKRQVLIHGEELHLSKKEYDLLVYFISNKGNALTKTSITEHLWGDHMDSADSLYVIYSHIKNLRKKLVEKGALDYVSSIYGIGYKFGEK
jgi:DNA-binding response OmpR family regulator